MSVGLGIATLLTERHDTTLSLDDPYFYLYFGSAPRPPSYFALECSQSEVGRVVRFDSLSKILSSGIRVGFISGPRPIVAAIDKHVRITFLFRAPFLPSISMILPMAFSGCLLIIPTRRHLIN